MRDFQRAKVYKAENEFHWENSMALRCVCPTRFRDLGITAEYVQWLYNTPTALKMRERRGLHKNHLEVGDGRGRRSGGGGTGYVTLPVWARCPTVIAHEVSHALYSGSKHGPVFAKTYWRLLTEVDDRHDTNLAVQLGTAFERNGVEW